MDPFRGLPTKGRFSAGAPLPAPRRSAHAFILAVGVLAFAAAHRLAYFLEDPAPHSHDAPAGHGYLPILELGAGAVALSAVLLFAAGLAWRSSEVTGGLVPLPSPLRLLLACGVAPAAIFVLVEFCERSFAAPPGLVLLTGVGLQLVLGCAALLASRRVLLAVAAVARGIAAPFPGGRRAGARLRPGPRMRPRVALIADANPSRAPPAA